MREQFGLSVEVLDKIRSIFRSHPLVEKVILYGSRAKGNYKPGSDVDLTLIAPKMELSELLQIENEIDDLLLPYKFDLSFFHKIDSETLSDHINRIGLDFYNRS